MVNLFLVEPSEAALGWTDQRPEPVVPELILEMCKPKIIADAFAEIYFDGKKRSQMLEKLALAKTKVRARDEMSPVEICVESLKEFCISKKIMTKDEVR